MSKDYDNSSINELIDEFVIQEINFKDVINNNKSEIEKLIIECSNRIQNKNKIFLIGSGTSGRLGMIESSEVYPTFGDNSFTGIIAGGPVRAVCEVLGVKDIVAKSMGTSNAHNVIRATMKALMKQSSPKQISAIRNKKISEIIEKRG